MIGVREVMEAAEGLPRMAGRSALYRWMMTNREELARELLGARPDWSALALVLGRHGLLDRNRHMPTGAVARMTWWRVRKDAERLHGAGVSEIDALSIAPQPEHLVDRRTKRRVRTTAKVRPNTAAKRAVPRDAPDVRVVVPEKPVAKPGFDRDAIMRDLAKGTEWMRPTIRREVVPEPAKPSTKVDV